jgi:hypothetical protein
VPPELPLVEPERSAEAVRRALLELLKLDRYERRASARRDRKVPHCRDQHCTSPCPTYPVGAAPDHPLFFDRRPRTSHRAVTQADSNAAATIAPVANNAP